MIVVFSSPSFPSVDCYVPPYSPSLLYRLTDRIDEAGNQLLHWFPLTSTSCARATAPLAQLRVPAEAVSMAAEATEGMNDDVGWLLWPLSDDL